VLLEQNSVEVNSVEVKVKNFGEEKTEMEVEVLWQKLEKEQMQILALKA